MKILITGMAGHVGSKLAQWVLREQPGTEVIGVDDLSCGYVESVPVGAKLIVGDAGNRYMHEEHGPFDVVYHLAAYAAECMSPFCRSFNYRNNLVTTSKLLSNLIDSGFAGRLVFASSIAAYGDACGSSPPFSEGMHCRPVDPYGVAKLACEQDIRIAGHQHGLDWCVVRPHNIYGPGQSIWQRYRNVLGLWMRAVLEGAPIVIFGDGRQQRAFSHVDDVLPCLWRAGTSDAPSEHVINLGGREPTSINELAELFRSVVGTVRIDRRPARHEVRKAWCTTHVSEELLDYGEAVGLEQGIREMWAWAQVAWKQFPERRNSEPHFEIETTRGMPEAWLETANVGKF